MRLHHLEHSALRYLLLGLSALVVGACSSAPAEPQSDAQTLAAEKQQQSTALQMSFDECVITYVNEYIALNPGPVSGPQDVAAEAVDACDTNDELEQYESLRLSYYRYSDKAGMPLDANSDMGAFEESRAKLDRQNLVEGDERTALSMLMAADTKPAG